MPEIPENFDEAADSGVLQSRLVGLLCFAGDLEVNGEEINGCALEIERSALSARPLPMYRQCAILPIGELRKMEAVVEAAKCIRHWHDREGGGMVVSSEHVRQLWAALHDLEANASVDAQIPAPTKPESITD
jgi:hypothetical protein